MTAQLLALDLQNKESAVIPMSGSEKLIISYKSSRAKKDAKNRKKGLEKLEKSITSGKLGKKNINNRGYNKYLKMEGDVDITINYDKYEDDKKWDGLKGYITNAPLSKEENIQQYGQLWHIERTFYAKNIVMQSVIWPTHIIQGVPPFTLL